ncbi:MAG: hypothetical protein DWI21_07485 [Planctomycetota bacterium]|nr:MAG: hypothetical protein DWI21_07485 [Planctomycetota bacterium]GDY09318.1 hypothetical protein LBMAG52_28040 [Planctomycetia bacterium]
MHFWRVENLKSELASRPMTDREVLPYFVVNAVLTSLSFAFPSSEFNLWDLLSTSWSIGLAVFGTIYLFHQNGGLTGTQFPQRFVAIGWVVGLRWCAWIIPLYFLCVITEIFAGETNVLEFLLDAMTETLLVHRIGFHIRDVALRTTASAAQAQPT